MSHDITLLASGRRGSIPPLMWTTLRHRLDDYGHVSIATMCPGEVVRNAYLHLTDIICEIVKNFVIVRRRPLRVTTSNRGPALVIILPVVRNDGRLS